MYVCDDRIRGIPDGFVCRRVSPDVSAGSGAVVPAVAGVYDGWGGYSDL